MNYYKIICKLTFHKFKFKKCPICYPINIVDTILSLVPAIIAVGTASFIAQAIQDKRLLNRGRPKKRKKCQARN